MWSRSAALRSPFGRDRTVVQHAGLGAAAPRRTHRRPTFAADRRARARSPLQRGERGLEADVALEVSRRARRGGRSKNQPSPAALATRARVGVRSGRRAAAAIAWPRRCRAPSRSGRGPPGSHHSPEHGGDVGGAALGRHEHRDVARTHPLDPTVGIGDRALVEQARGCATATSASDDALDVRRAEPSRRAVERTRRLGHDADVERGAVAERVRRARWAPRRPAGTGCRGGRASRRGRARRARRAVVDRSGGWCRACVRSDAAHRLEVGVDVGAAEAVDRLLRVADRDQPVVCRRLGRTPPTGVGRCPGTRRRGRVGTGGRAARASAGPSSGSASRSRRSLINRS